MILSQDSQLIWISLDIIKNNKKIILKIPDLSNIKIIVQKNYQSSVRKVGKRMGTKQKQIISQYWRVFLVLLNFLNIWRKESAHFRKNKTKNFVN